MAWTPASEADLLLPNYPPRSCPGTEEPILQGESALGGALGHGGPLGGTGALALRTGDVLRQK